MIYLRVGRLEVDWGKNTGFADHNSLFQPADLAKVPYYYVDRRSEADPSDLREVIESEEGYRWALKTEWREGYCKPLSEVIDRIELLGHTDAYCRREFSYLAELNAFDESSFTYGELARVLHDVDVTSLSLDYGEGREDFGKFFRRQIFPRLPFTKFATDPDHVRYRAVEAMENLSPYTVLRLLGENPSARGLPVIWAFADVVDGGWAQRSHLVHPLAAHERFSILTEGTSDAAILKKALALLQPHIADFFGFVDVGHPFSGTGQVYNFVRGLVAIGVHNSVLVVFDNDAEGCAAWARCRQLSLPGNVRVLKLPDLPEFNRVSVDGPTGRGLADINGRAAAIECYLDLGPSPQFRWSNYNSHIDAYQGELVGKDDYKRAFLDQDRQLTDYSYEKLGQVLEILKRNATEMNEAKLLRGLAEDATVESEEG